jgi:hypothetical protein
MATVKYVRLQGYAQIGVADDGRLTLLMCSNDGKPHPGIQPIVFSHLPESERASFGQGTPPPPIRFLKIDLLAEFNQQDFERYLPLWGIIEPGLTWETALDPTPETMPHMNPTGPPPTP